MPQQRRARLSPTERSRLEAALAATIAPALELPTRAERLKLVGERLLGNNNNNKPPQPSSTAAASSSTSFSQQQAVDELASAFAAALLSAAQQRQRERSSQGDDTEFLLQLVGQSLIAQGDRAAAAALAGPLVDRQPAARSSPALTISDRPAGRSSHYSKGLAGLAAAAASAPSPAAPFNPGRGRLLQPLPCRLFAHLRL